MFAFFGKEGSPPLVDTYESLTKGKEISEQYSNETWESITAKDGWGNLIPEPAVQTFDGEQVYTMPQRHTVTGQFRTAPVDPKAMPPPDDAENKPVIPPIPSEVREQLEIINQLSFHNPLLNEQADLMRGILEDSKDLLSSKTTAQAQNLRKQIDNLLFDPELTTADTFMGAVWHGVRGTFMRSAMSNKEVQKLIQGRVDGFIRNTLQPHMNQINPEWKLIYVPDTKLKKHTVEGKDVYLQEPSIQKRTGPGFYLRGTSGAHNFIPGPGGTGQIRAMPTDGPTTFMDKTKTPVRYWGYRDKYFFNAEAEYIYLSKQQLRDAIGELDVTQIIKESGLQGLNMEIQKLTSGKKQSRQEWDE
jgi:hypothetical protein